MNSKYKPKDLTSCFHPQFHSRAKTKLISQGINEEQTPLGWIQKEEYMITALSTHSTQFALHPLRHLTSPFELLLRGIYPVSYTHLTLPTTPYV